MAIEQRSLAIREQSCAQCHGPPPAPGFSGFNFILDDTALVTKILAPLTAPLVVAGNPSGSLLMQRIAEGIAGSQTGMPPPSSVASNLASASIANSIVYPTAEDVSLLNAWIQSCVPGSTPIGSSDAGGPDGEGGGPVEAGDADGGPSSRGPGDGAAVAVDAPAAPPGLAGFAFVVNDEIQTPLNCPAENWAFAPPTAQGDTASPLDAEEAVSAVVCTTPPPCAGLTSVLLVNTGSYPVAYTAQSNWNVGGGSGYPPGVNFGEPNEMTGVLAPGAQVDIVSVYQGGLTAVLGSSAPFSEPDASKYAADEGTIPWPAGVTGSEGATQMYVAEIEIVSGCGHPTVIW